MGALGRRLVIGIGNPDRGDDGVGRAVIHKLHGRVPADVTLLEQEGEAATLVGWLEGAATALIIDAAITGAAPGSVTRLDANTGPVPVGLGSMSSHGLGVAQAIELARILGVLPPCCIVLAIEAASFEPGATLSPAVEAAAEDAAAMILSELAASPG